MKTAKLIEYKESQVLLLPEEFQFTGISEVVIDKKGDCLVISPKRKSWTSFSKVDKAPEDFLTKRSDLIK